MDGGVAGLHLGLRAAPDPVALGTGRALGALCRAPLRVRRRVVDAQLAASFPAATPRWVRDTARAAAFYRDVLDAEVHYQDVDFAAVRVGPAEVMLHADHTHDDHPWSSDLAGGATRGVGAQMRLLGIDPDAVEARAREHGAQLVAGASDKGHGWRETLVRDPDGYEWAVGVLIEPARGPFGPHEVAAP